MSLILLSARPTAAPERVRDVRLACYTGMHGEAQTMVSWEGVALSRPSTPMRCCAPINPDGSFVRVNTPDLICTAFLDVRETNAANGFYRVRAVDFWGRRGPESETASPN